MRAALRGVQHPWALLAWSAACLAVVLVSTSPVYRAIVVAAALAMVAGPVRPGLSRRPLLADVAFAGAGAVLFNFALSHTGATAVITLPAWLPVLGGPLTLESAAFGGTTALGLAGGILAVAPVGYVLTPDDVLDALPRHLERTGAALATTVALVPGLLRSQRAIREAQQMRGWRPTGPRSWADIAVPVALTAMEDSLQVAEAMEARAFGSGPRTAWRRLEWTPADLVAIAAAALCIAAFAGARVLGVPVDWLTYPTLAAPPAAAALLVAAGLLSLPAVLRWRSRS